MRLVISGGTSALAQEGLLDRHEVLSWLLELLEKMKITDDTVLKLVLTQVLKVRVASPFQHCSSRCPEFHPCYAKRSAEGKAARFSLSLFPPQYMSEFVQTQWLARRLAHFCARKLSQMISDSGCGSPRTQSPLVSPTPNGYCVCMCVRVCVCVRSEMIGSK